MSESEWRMNVWRLGMSRTTWELAARILPLTFVHGYVVKESPTTRGLWALLPPFTGLPVRAGGPFIIPPGERFPYGQAVVPD